MRQFRKLAAQKRAAAAASVAPAPTVAGRALGNVPEEEAGFLDSVDPFSLDEAVGQPVVEQPAVEQPAGESPVDPAPAVPVVGQDLSLQQLFEQAPEAIQALGIEGIETDAALGTAVANALAAGNKDALLQAGLSKEQAAQVFNTAKVFQIGLENQSHQVSLDGQTTIRDGVGRDEVVISGVADFGKLDRSRDGDDLVLGQGADSIRIAGFYDEANDSVERIRLGDASSGDHDDTTIYREELLVDERPILDQDYTLEDQQKKGPRYNPRTGRGRRKKELKEAAANLSEGDLSGLSIDQLTKISKSKRTTRKVRGIIPVVDDPIDNLLDNDQRAELNRLLVKHGALVEKEKRQFRGRKKIVQEKGTIADQEAFQAEIKQFALAAKRKTERGKAMQAYAESSLDDSKTLIFGTENRKNKQLNRGFDKVTKKGETTEDFGDGRGAEALAKADRAQQELASFNELSDADKGKRLNYFAKKGQKKSTFGKVLGAIGAVASFFPGVGTLVGAVANGLSAVASGGSLLDGVKAGFGSFLSGGGFGGGLLTKLAGTALQGGFDAKNLALGAVGGLVGQTDFGKTLGAAGIGIGPSGINIGAGPANIGIGLDGDVRAGLSVNENFSVNFAEDQGLGLGLGVGGNQFSAFSNGDFSASRGLGDLGRPGSSTQLSLSGNLNSGALGLSANQVVGAPGMDASGLISPASVNQAALDLRTGGLTGSTTAMVSGDLLAANAGLLAERFGTSAAAPAGPASATPASSTSSPAAQAASPVTASSPEVGAGEPIFVDPVAVATPAEATATAADTVTTPSVAPASSESAQPVTSAVATPSSSVASTTETSPERDGFGLDDVAEVARQGKEISGLASDAISQTEALVKAGGTVVDVAQGGLGRGALGVAETIAQGEGVELEPTTARGRVASSRPMAALGKAGTVAGAAGNVATLADGEFALDDVAATAELAKLAPSTLKKLGMRVIPGANGLVAVVDTTKAADAIQAAIAGEGSVTDAIFATITAGGSIAGATNIPILSQIGTGVAVASEFTQGLVSSGGNLVDGARNLYDTASSGLSSLLTPTSGGRRGRNRSR